MTTLRQFILFILIAIFSLGVINPAKNYERDSGSHLLVYKVHHFFKVDKLKQKTPAPSRITAELTEETLLTSDTSLLTEAFYNSSRTNKAYVTLDSAAYISFHPELLTRPPTLI